MSNTLLQQIGLTEDQSTLYAVLVGSGPLSARKLAIDTGITRTLVYKVLKQLEELDLVREHEYEGKIRKFSALSPNNLKKIVDQKNEQTKLANSALHEAVSVLGSQFNLTCGKPTVLFYEGVEGIKILNKDILRTKKDIRIIRSPLDNNNDELDSMVQDQIKSQVELGIHAKVIVPMKHNFDDFVKERDKTNLVTRCRIPVEEFSNNVQITLYGNKVAFTSFVDCMVTTIIEDKSIHETMSVLFNTLWEKYAS